MARMRSAPSAVGRVNGDRFDLARSFRYLGRGPSYRQLDVVVKRLHDAGLKELDYDQQLQDLADANGSMAIVALDLHVAFYHGVEALHAGPEHSRGSARRDGRR